LGDVEQAADCYEKAIVIFDAIESPSAATVRGWLAKLRGGT
jgi:hypothetical protein